MSEPLHPMDGSRLAEAIYIIGTVVEDGPFMQFLTRVAEAEAVPSCDSCKFAKGDGLTKMCTLRLREVYSPLFSHSPIFVNSLMFCAAWEVKA